MTDMLTSKMPEEVTLGPIRMFCENFRAELNSVMVEKPTVYGEPIITNHYRRAVHYTFTGRIPADDEAMIAVANINNVCGAVGFTVHYKELVFTDCIVLGYSAEDDGGDFVKLTVTLASESPILYGEDAS